MKLKFLASLMLIIVSQAFSLKNPIPDVYASPIEIKAFYRSEYNELRRAVSDFSIIRKALPKNDADFLDMAYKDNGMSNLIRFWQSFGFGDSQDFFEAARNDKASLVRVLSNALDLIKPSTCFDSAGNFLFETPSCGNTGKLLIDKNCFRLDKEGKIAVHQLDGNGDSIISILNNNSYSKLKSTLNQNAATAIIAAQAVKSGKSNSGNIDLSLFLRELSDEVQKLRQLIVKEKMDDAEGRQSENKYSVFNRVCLDDYFAEKKVKLKALEPRLNPIQYALAKRQLSMRSVCSTMVQINCMDVKVLSDDFAYFYTNSHCQTKVLALSAADRILKELIESGEGSAGDVSDNILVLQECKRIYESGYDWIFTYQLNETCAPD